MKNFCNKEIKKWSEAYDHFKYPFGIYKNLVIENKINDRKLELMGAWKTGSLRVFKDGQEYKDTDGNQYGFTKRWKPEAPVGYSVWLELSENSTEYYKKIPDTFPTHIAPPIVEELVSKNGFGYIWSLFVLHCIHPEEYPLYDQHVYRAYRDINNLKLTNLAPNCWDDYEKYRAFFIEMVKSSGEPFWVVDRALWTYGKFKKPEVSKLSINQKRPKPLKFVPLDDGWVHLITLGGKAKSFWWKINDDLDITIKRKFNLSNGNLLNTVIFSRDELNDICEMIDHYDEWVPLANNVAKLGNGTEQDGLGRFIYNNFGNDLLKAQASSQLGPIFYSAGIWEWNQHKSGIKFKTIKQDWSTVVKSYYLSSVEN